MSPASPRRSTPSPERIAYGPHADQFTERFGDSPRVAALLHGGFWRASYDCSLEHAVARDLAERGWTAINVEYRRGKGWDAMCEDVRAALTVREPEVVIGHSAGGHLALWAAAEGLAPAAVSQAGVNDLREAARLNLSDGAVHELVGAEIPPAADPAQRRPIDARLLCVHGALDTEVPVSMSEMWEGEADVVVIADEGHYEHLDPASQVWRAVVEWL